MDLLYTAHVPEGDGPFPTLVALHGWGASAHDLIGLAPFLHRGKALVLCPQGPVQVPIAEGVVGYGWFPLTLGAPPNPRDFELGTRAVRRFLEAACERYPIARNKLVLLGFSQGGAVAYDVALREPERFAGVAALSSWLPEPLAASILVQDAHANLPVFIAHGTDDSMISIDKGRASRDALLKFHVPLTFHEYEMGHEILPETLRDLVHWLENKVLSPIVLA